MDEYFEIEITDKQGNKFYEICSCRKDVWDLCRLHKGVSVKSIPKGE